MCIRDRVKESQLPTVDDEFAKDVSEFETLADFKKDLGEKLTQRRTAEAQNDFEQAILEQLVDNLEAVSYTHLVPAPLAALRSKESRFRQTVEKEHMVDAVLGMLE